MKLKIGLDIGGTKCAISTGECEYGAIKILSREEFPTAGLSWQQVLDEFARRIEKLADNGHATCDDRHAVAAIGISCGGPLDSREGVIMSPPNLPGWDNIPITRILEDEFGVKAAVHNDANACALAEWQFGAGRGTRNMVFLTFGTGLGAGLILDGKLFAGTNDNAGELGHIRLDAFGPVGYGKAGSFEGFCSGSGIAQLAASMVKERLQMGRKVDWCPDGNLSAITARTVAEAARRGDALAREVYSVSARYLGKGLSIVIDILNPELIVIGSIYARNEDLLKPLMEEVLSKEALPLANKVCRVVPAALGESIGDYAALSVAANI